MTSELLLQCRYSFSTNPTYLEGSKRICWNYGTVTESLNDIIYSIFTSQKRQKYVVFTKQKNTIIVYFFDNGLISHSLLYILWGLSITLLTSVIWKILPICKHVNIYLIIIL